MSEEPFFIVVILIVFCLFGGSMSGFQFQNAWGGGYNTCNIQSFTAPTAVTEQLVIGDIVIATTTSDSEGRWEIDTPPNPGVAQVLGVIHGIQAVPLDVTGPVTPPGSTVRIAEIDLNPYSVYLVDVESGSSLVAANVGSNAQFNNPGPDVNGNLVTSGQTLDLANIGSSATLPLRIIRLVKKGDETVGTNFNRALVMLNNTNLSVGTVGFS